MIEILVRVATTGTIVQGGSRVVITKEMLESLVEQAKSDSSIPVTVEHNPFLMPLGKFLDAWIEPFGSEYAVMARIGIEDNPASMSHARTGVPFVRMNFANDPRMVKQRYYGSLDPEADSLSVDLANFDSPSRYAMFVNEVRVIDESVITSNGVARHSMGPEPFLQYIISNLDPNAALSLVVVWAGVRAEKFVRYTVDETLRKVADEISDALSGKLKSVVRAYRSNQSQDHRDTTIQIVIPGDMDVILLVKTPISEDLPLIEMAEIAKELERYGDILQGAHSATFALNSTGDWKLRYITTKSGEVVGTQECFDETLDALKKMSPPS